MQQAYRVLRIVAESQTIRIVLTGNPDELMLSELRTACTSLDTESSLGIKAVVLDFGESNSHGSVDGAAPLPSSFANSKEVIAALRNVAQPLLAVVRATPSAMACALIWEADLTLVADDAELVLSTPEASGKTETLTGLQAARLGYITWSASAGDLNKEMERILNQLREKSAIALRHTKASVRLAQEVSSTRLDALNQVNAFYLERVMRSLDATEGLRAFLEKREPNWKNM